MMLTIRHVFLPCQTQCEVAAQAGDNSRADSDRWWRRSTDTSAPTSPSRERNAPGQTGGATTIAARRSCSMPDPMSMAPPRDLTIPEHPEEHSGAAPGDCNLQARAVSAARTQEGARAHYGHAGSGTRPGSMGPQGPLFRGGQGLPASGGGQPRRGFGSGASAPVRAPAGAAAAAAAALKVGPSPRSSSDSQHRASADRVGARTSLETQARSSSDRLQTSVRTEKASDSQEVPAMMR